MKTISVKDLKSKIQEENNIQIIDIREDYEFEENNIGGINIPMENVLTSLDKIDVSKQIVLCCKTGIRAAAMTHTLERKLNLKNIFFLEGGVLEYLDIKE